MSEIDAEAIAHRTLDIRLAKLPWDLETMPEKYIKSLRKVGGARIAYMFRGDKFAPIMYLPKKGIAFADHATPWEKLHSTLVLGEGSVLSAHPVVDQAGVVIGHFGYFPFGRLYSIGRHASGESEAGLNALIEQGLVLAHRNGSLSDSPSGILHIVGMVETTYGVITDPNGLVLQIISRITAGAITPVNVSPADLVAVPRLLGLIGRTVMKKIVSTLARRRLSKHVARGPASELNRPLPRPPSIRDHVSIPVRVGAYGQPASVWGQVTVTPEGVTYVVKAIILRGEGDKAAIQLARAAHRKMIRRAALEAQKAGRRTFKFYGDQAGPAFRRHADDLANKVGIPKSGKVIKNTAGAHDDYEVTLSVDKVLGLKQVDKRWLIPGDLVIDDKPHKSSK